MLQEKRSELDGEKQKKLLQRLVGELSTQRPDLYYQPTAVIAEELQAYIARDAKLYAEERTLLQQLGKRDIELMLSLH